MRYVLKYIFLKSMACLFVLSTMSFREWRFLILVKSKLSTFFLQGSCPGVLSKHSIPKDLPHRSSSMFSCRSFTVFHFIFISIIPFQL